MRIEQTDKVQIFLFRLLKGGARNCYIQLGGLENKMSVFEKIRRSIQPGEIFCTPSEEVPFSVETIDADNVTFRVGEGKWKIKVPTECWEGIPDYLRGRGWVRIGAVHDTADEGTLEAYLDKYVQSSSSSYVVPILEHIGIVEVRRSRPAEVRLIE